MVLPSERHSLAAGKGNATAKTTDPPYLQPLPQTRDRQDQTWRKSQPISLGKGISSTDDEQAK